MNRTLMQFKHVLGAIFFLLISVKGFSQPVAPAFSTSTVAPFTNPNLTSFVIDYNNDGVDDIVGFTTQYANTGKLWKNNGNGTFSDVSSTVTFSNYNWTGALDFDRNGLMDVYQLTGDTLRISFNTATGFTTPDANCGYYLLSNLFGTASTSIFNSIIGDYDGDGVYDILSQVVIGTSTKINAVKGQLGCVSGCSFKFPSQTASTLVSLSNATNTLFQLADIDNDFDMDLLVGRGVRYQNFTYSIYKKSATGYTLFSGSGYDVGRHSGFGMLGEFNNDGRTDIVSGAEDCCVAAGDALYVYYSNPNGTYTANNSAMLRNASEDPYYFKATIIDINLDKTQDIIWTEMSAINTSKTQVFLNDNFSTFTESSAAMNLHNGYTNGLCCPITLFTRATVLDINNDKKPDVNIAQIDELSPFSNTNNWQRINTTTNNSVKLKLIACNGLKEGWGARIRYKVGGVWYYQQHNAYSSSGYPFLYLGMGTATTIETIEVTWFGGAVTTASGVNAGEFKVMEENANCTNDALSSFSFNSLTDTTTNCGVTATLSGPAGFASYSWNNGATTQSISATANGVYKLTVTNNSGCNAYDSTYLSLVKSDIFQNNSTICKGTTVLLSVDSSFAAQNLNSINLLPSNLKVGLKAYYPFSGNANDASGNNNNGTVTGATLTTDRFGNANSAYSFNGSSFIDLGNIAGVGYSTTQDITMSFWINEGASGTVISKYTNLDAANSNFFISKATSTAQLAGNGTNSFTANNITDYRWTNYVFIAASGSNKSFLYRNGVLVATGTLSANGALSATKIMLGKLMGSPSNFFTGKIDDVFIYNRALAASEVSQLSNFQPKVTWSNGATTNTISVTPTVTTKYYATVTDGITSCMDSVTVTVSDIGAYNPFPAQSSTCGTTKSLEAGAGYTSYLWSTGATSQTISPTLNGNYSVTVTNAAGCSASDTVTVSLLNADIIQSNQTVCANTTLNLFIDSTFSGSAINAKSQMSANLQTGLVAFYPFTGNASDVSGNNNVLTANGVTLTTDRFGRSNSAYSFTNTQTSVTNYLKAVNPTPFAKNTYTISAWFNS
ncbi:MAG: ASPIC/UnbV domain-containing protein, partial [Chitinophagaceae bacterium]|nr:ASPIC/UnbV domain-containing protein [Chitinophagaceae bacterium]